MCVCVFFLYLEGPQDFQSKTQYVGIANDVVKLWLGFEGLSGEVRGF